MPTVPLRYAPPANVADFDESRSKSDELRTKWHEEVSARIAAQTVPDDNELCSYPGERSFFDALGSGAVPVPVPWFAFPQALSAWYPDDDEKRWEAADTLFPRRAVKCRLQRDEEGMATGIEEVYEEFTSYYRQQDEYCEWHVHSDPATQTVTRIDFTSENPDYWDVLAETDIDLAVRKYRQYVSAEVQPEDLICEYDIVAFDANGQRSVIGERGKYDRYNKWNTELGAMHLTHPANNLFAEIVLAAQATVQRPSSAAGPFTPTSLACCAGYGGVRRSSDPLIGFTVNKLVADGFRVALADPVGLYIALLDRDADGTWEVSRGSESDRRILRASFYPDPGSEVKYGGQIADNMQMNLYAIGEKQTERAPAPEPCRGRCCDYPGKPNVHDYVGPVICSEVQWAQLSDDFVPYPRDDEDADPGLAVAGAAAEIPMTLPPSASQPSTRAYRGGFGAAV